METSQPRLHIFYDGGCKVCSWEIKKYLKIDRQQVLGTIDIQAPDFDAQRYGLDAKQVQKYFHVLTSDGRVIAGVDAFIEIWKTLDTPVLKRAAIIAKNPALHALLKIGYSGFVAIRPYLPRNPEVACDDGTCSHLSRPKKGV